MSYPGTFIILIPTQMPQMPALIPIQMPQMLQTNTITVPSNNTTYSAKPASTSTTQTPITKFITEKKASMPQMPALIPIKMLQTNTITVPSNNTTYSIKPASTSTTQTPITKFITEKKASMPQRPSQPLYAPRPVEWPAHKPHNVARAEKWEKLLAESTTNAQSSQPQPNPSLSYFSGLTAVQASKRGRPQSEDVTQEEQVAATEIKKHHHKRLTFDTKKQYHAQLYNNEITEAELEDKGFSYWQILAIKKAEPKPHKPHKRERHKRLSFDTRTEYHAKLNNGEVTEADLKTQGFSYWQILAIKKAKPKRPKRLSFDTRTEYHAKLNNGEFTEADLKAKELSDWQISSLQKAKPKRPKRLSFGTRIEYHAKLNNGEFTEADLKAKELSDWQISSLQAKPKPSKPHKRHKPHKPLSLETRTKYHA